MTRQELLPRDRQITIAELAKITGLDPSLIKQIGIYAVFNNYLAQKGIPDVLRCEADGRTVGQYLGDLLADLE